MRRRANPVRIIHFASRERFDDRIHYVHGERVQIVPVFKVPLQQNPHTAFEYSGELAGVVEVACGDLANKRDDAFWSPSLITVVGLSERCDDDPENSCEHVSMLSERRRFALLFPVVEWGIYVAIPCNINVNGRDFSLSNVRSRYRIRRDEWPFRPD